MKVCTDSCLFGAWVADRVKKQNPAVKTGVDIGTGTGLLALMLAQELLSIQIEAIEIDTNAAMQASENFKASPFTARLTVQHTGMEDYTGKPEFDLVICNPPFYKDDLQSPNDTRNMAHHEADLTLRRLLASMGWLFNERGSFGAILIPYARTDELLKELKRYSLHLVEKMYVRQTPRHPNFRTMVLFSNKKVDKPAIKQMTIKNENAEYSEEFQELLKEYYLAF